MIDDEQLELFNANYSLAAYVLTKFFGGYDEDLHQDALEALWKAAGKFDRSKGTKFTTFAVKTIRNRISSVLRDGRVQKRNDSGNISLETEIAENLRIMDVVGVEEHMDSSIDIDGLKKALSTREWKILVLRLRGYKCREIGKHFGISASNVASVLDHIRKKAKRFM